MSFEKSGTAEFPVDGAPRVFSFKASVAEDKLQIWIEDSVTKEQWQTKPLAIAEFVTLDTAIPRATASDYAVRIVECLAPTSDADKPTRSLSSAPGDGSRLLCVGFSLQAMTFCTALEYSFTLLPIKLNPTDLLASRIRDLEVRVGSLTEENTSLQTTVSSLTTKLKAIEAKPTSGLVCARFKVGSDKARGDKLLVWTPIPGFPLDGLTLDDKGSTVAVGINGVYSLTLDIPKYLNLLVNGKRVRVEGSSQVTILGAGDVVSIERESIYTSANGHVSLVLTRELPRAAVEAAAKEAAVEDTGNQADEPVFDAFATTGDY